MVKQTTPTMIAAIIPDPPLSCGDPGCPTLSTTALSVSPSFGLLSACDTVLSVNLMSEGDWVLFTDAMGVVILGCGSGGVVGMRGSLVLRATTRGLVEGVGAAVEGVVFTGSVTLPTQKQNTKLKKYTQNYQTGNY